MKDFVGILPISPSIVWDASIGFPGIITVKLPASCLNSCHSSTGIPPGIPFGGGGGVWARPAVAKMKMIDKRAEGVGVRFIVYSSEKGRANWQFALSSQKTA